MLYGFTEPSSQIYLIFAAANKTRQATMFSVDKGLYTAMVLGILIISEESSEASRVQISQLYYNLHFCRGHCIEILLTLIPSSP